MPLRLTSGTLPVCMRSNGQITQLLSMGSTDVTVEATGTWWHPHRPWSLKFIKINHTRNDYCINVRWALQHDIQAPWSQVLDTRTSMSHGIAPWVGCRWLQSKEAALGCCNRWHGHGQVVSYACLAIDINSALPWMDILYTCGAAEEAETKLPMLSTSTSSQYLVVRGRWGGWSKGSKFNSSKRWIFCPRAWRFTLSLVFC